MASVFTLNPDGTVSIALSPQLIASQIPAGAFAALPAAPNAGDTFLALDQPTGQQLYVCGKSGQWTQLLNLGGSGALKFAGGSLDVNLAIVPLMESENTFTGLNHFVGDVDFRGKVTGLPTGNKIWAAATSAIAQPVVTSIVLGFPTDLPGSTPGIHTSAKNFTVPVTGFYRGYAEISAVPTGGSVYLAIQVNGQQIGKNGWAGGYFGGFALQTQFSRPLNQGDVLTAVASSPWAAFSVQQASFLIEN